MKKFTFLIVAAFAIVTLQAQISYTTVLTDDFESSTKDFVIGSTTFKTGGIPSNFNVLKQTIWTTFSATNNPYIYTGSVWKDIFSNNGTPANKTYSVVAVAENRPGGIGSQCLKFNMTSLAFGSYATPFVGRLRSNDNVLSFVTATGESVTKYEVSFWARIDGADKVVLLNSQNPNTYLTLSSTWQKYTISRYVTGITATAFAIDFYPLSDNADYSVYLDDFEVKQRKIAYTSAATNISVNSFTANWSAVTGANSYSVIVEKTDGAATPTWTPVVGSPFMAGNVQTYAVNNLDAGTYRYRAVATDGTITTVESNNTFATLTVSGLNDISIKSFNIVQGKVSVATDAGNIIEIFNVTGQKIKSITSIGNIAEYQLQNKGIYVVRVNSDTRKVIF